MSQSEEGNAFKQSTSPRFPRMPTTTVFSSNFKTYEVLAYRGSLLSNNFTRRELPFRKKKPPRRWEKNVPAPSEEEDVVVSDSNETKLNNDINSYIPHLSEAAAAAAARVRFSCGGTIVIQARCGVRRPLVLLSKCISRKGPCTRFEYQKG